MSWALGTIGTPEKQYRRFGGWVTAFLWDRWGQPCEGEGTEVLMALNGAMQDLLPLPEILLSIILFSEP